MRGRQWTGWASATLCALWGVSGCASTSSSTGGTDAASVDATTEAGADASASDVGSSDAIFVTPDSCEPLCTTCGGDDGCGGKCATGSCEAGYCDAGACTCSDTPKLTCTVDHLYQCKAGVPTIVACDKGCITHSPDDLCIDIATTAWSCAKSGITGRQVWTCNALDGYLYECDATGKALVIKCPSRCRTPPFPGLPSTCN